MMAVLAHSIGGDKVTGRVEMKGEAFGALSQRLGPRAPGQSEPAATPLFNATKAIAKLIIVGVILAYALWPARAYLSQMLGAPATQASLTNN